eukprot:CAMPEP_0185022602 /NCGR_PEP_ID=MMETSP1103-20130426/5306_1 /TAXON_ID=36769 /ORGANISM="Paraphysomonas bandaiensis, Strain Caron Lab Isolate" /LENGTH=275 /DNA_ID=CAMNT_0027554739 /DNA_START=350 /DNA_END=1174 /DNA_ORIENTATION=-
MGKLDDLCTRIPVIYFDDPDTFSEMQDFMESCQETFGLDYLTYNCPFKDGVQNAVNSRNVKAIFMGVRRGDPHTMSAEHMDPSSVDWPAFMRVYPILSWSYTDVWSFLLSCQVPYCKLYDKGYTSVGLKHNTFPHPALLLEECAQDGGAAYLPAYRLGEYEKERACRADTAPTEDIQRNGEGLAIFVLYNNDLMSSYISEILHSLNQIQNNCEENTIEITPYTISSDFLSAQLRRKNDSFVVVISHSLNRDLLECKTRLSLALRGAHSSAADVEW